MSTFTVVFEVPVDAPNAERAVQVARRTHPTRYIPKAVHIGEPDGVNPPLLPCCECGRFVDILEQQEVRDDTFMCLPCARDYTA